MIRMSVGRRLLAWGLDQCFLFGSTGMFFLAVWGLFFLLVSEISFKELGLGDRWGSLFLFLGIRWGWGLFYEAVGLYYYGTTLGKRCCGIRVISTLPGEDLFLTWTQVMLRLLGRWISYGYGVVALLGWCLHPERRAFHELLSETVCTVWDLSPSFQRKHAFGERE